MILKTERLILRPISLKDLERVYSYSSDLENVRYMLYYPQLSLDETFQNLFISQLEWKKQQPDMLDFGIELDGSLIGEMQLYILDEDKVEIGWLLDKAYWHQGYAIEAAREVVNYAREVLSKKVLIAQCDGRNLASQKVMEKLGMKLVDDKGIRSYVKRQETATEYTYELVL